MLATGRSFGVTWFGAANSTDRGIGTGGGLVGPIREDGFGPRRVVMAHAAAHPRRVARGLGTLVLACAFVGALFGTWPRAAAAQADLMEVLSAVVAVEARIPGDARTAAVLGDERLGSGIVIDGAGLVVTIGYLILEASDAWIRTGGGQRVPAEVVAYDHETGFGLLRAQAPLDKVVPMALGDSDTLVEGTPAVIASFGGPGALLPVVTVSRRAFAGYWEYLLENAIFTSPPHRFFGGAALMSTGGRLVGVGSLIVPDAAVEPAPAPGNMFVPVAQLKSVLADLIVSGRSANPLRPWLGVFADERDDGRVVVQSLAADGPAMQAGIEPGDVIVAAGDLRVDGLADFYRKLWDGRGPGDRVTLTVERGGESRSIEVLGGNRYRWLRLGSDF